MTSPVNMPKPPKKRRSSLKRQRMLVAIMLCVVLVLGVAFAIVHYFTSRTAFYDWDNTKYYIVNDNGVYSMTTKDGDVLTETEEGYYVTALGTVVDVDEETGEFSVVAAVPTTGSETLEFSKYKGTFDVLLYPVLQRANIQSIEIVNEKDSFAFVRDAAGTSFEIKGHPGIAYDSNMFATLVVCTGYTATYMRLDSQKVKEYGFGEYGLPENPAEAKTYFVITDTAGNSHKVIVGDIIPSGAGYYACYEGRDEVYVMKDLEESEYNSTFTKTIVESVVEDYVTPISVMTMTNSNYFDVSNFKLNTVKPITDAMLSDPDFNANDMLTNVITFSYSPIEQRTGTFYSNLPYTGQGAYSGYHINSDRVDDCLQNIRYMETIRTERLLSSEENEIGELIFAAEYGIAYCLEYTHNTARAGADQDYKVTDSIYQQVWISPLTDDGTYFLYNAMFGMIIEVGRSQLEYLEWAPYAWIETDVFVGNIVYLDKIEMDIPTGVLVNGETVYSMLFDVDNHDSLSEWDKSSDQAASIPTNLMKVWANGSPADLSQFKKFFQTLIYSSLSGMATCSEEDQAAYREASTLPGHKKDDIAPYLVITMTFNTEADGSGENVVRTFCFYRYSQRQCFVTLNGNGSFYMLQPRVEKIINDVARVFNGETINPQGKN